MTRRVRGGGGGGGSAAARGRRRGLGTVAAGRGETRFTVRPGILAAWGLGGVRVRRWGRSARARASPGVHDGERRRWRRGRERGAGIAARARTWPTVALAVALIPSSVSASGGFRPAVARPGLGRLLIGRGRRGGGVSERAGNATSPGVRETRDRIAERRYADARGPSIASRPERTSFFFFPPLVTTANFSTAIEEGEGGGASEGGGEVSAGRRAEKSQRRPPSGCPPRFFAGRRAVKRVSPRSRRCTHCP